jgi:hypothetical protein
MHRPGDVEPLACGAADAQIRIQIRGHQFARQRLRIERRDLEVDRYPLLQYAHLACHRNRSRRGGGGEALDLQGAGTADDGGIDIREAHAARIVAHAALRQVHGALDLRVGNAAGHLGVDRQLAAGVLAARLEQRIDHSDIEFAVDFQIERSVRGQRRLTRDAEPRSGAGRQVSIHIRGVAPQLRRCRHIEGRQSEGGVVRGRQAFRVEPHLARGSRQAAAQLRVGCNAAGFHQTGNERVDERGLRLQQRRLYVELRREFSLEFKYSRLRSNLQVIDGYAVRQRNPRRRHQMQLQPMIVRRRRLDRNRTCA